MKPYEEAVLLIGNARIAWQQFSANCDQVIDGVIVEISNTGGVPLPRVARGLCTTEGVVAVQRTARGTIVDEKGGAHVGIVLQVGRLEQDLETVTVNVVVRAPRDGKPTVEVEGKSYVHPGQAIDYATHVIKIALDQLSSKYLWRVV
jgi:hypothetical protein